MAVTLEEKTGPQQEAAGRGVPVEVWGAPRAKKLWPPSSRVPAGGPVTGRCTLPSYGLCTALPRVSPSTKPAVIAPTLPPCSGPCVKGGGPCSQRGVAFPWLAPLRVGLRERVSPKPSPPARSLFCHRPCLRPPGRCALWNGFVHFSFFITVCLPPSSARSLAGQGGLVQSLVGGGNSWLRANTRLC